MVAGSTAFVVSLLYLGALFGIAHIGAISRWHYRQPQLRALIYALGLCIYCTSWSFYGSVGLASVNGYGFIPVYIGPILVFVFGRSAIVRILRLSRTHNITSVADFLACRYGKSDIVAAVAAVIAVIGVIPYIALQLRAIAESFIYVSLAMSGAAIHMSATGLSPTAVWVAVMLAVFAMVFGTRKIEANERQNGLMLAIAAESLFKLLAFLAAGIYASFFVAHGFGDVAAKMNAAAGVSPVFSMQPDWASWIAITFLSACAVLMLPRQFHVAIVENRNETDVKTAAFVFPVYLVAINLFVIPLAVAGLATFPDPGFNRDLTVLALPLHHGSLAMAFIVMLGGFSAASAMVIVACVALSIMVSNDLLIPLLLRWHRARRKLVATEISGQILLIRRFSIVLVLALACLYLQFSTEAALAAIGLLAFAAIAQFAPAFLGALYWARGTARGAVAGMIAGILVWAWTLLLPSLGLRTGLGSLWLADSSGGMAFLNANAFSGMVFSNLVLGVGLSMAANILAFVGFSLSRAANPIENLQASIFVGAGTAPGEPKYHAWISPIRRDELQALVAHYIGVDRARALFAEFAGRRDKNPLEGAEANAQEMGIAQQALTSVIGAASSRLVLSLALQRPDRSRQAARQLADDASAAIYSNRDLLQHAIDFARQGISIFDADLRLVFWNREFREIFLYASDALQIGMRLDDVLRLNARRGLYGPGQVEDLIVTKREMLVNAAEPYRLAFPERGHVIEMRASRMPDGGLVVIYTDVSDQVEAEEALASINETLERRVEERTQQLVALNAELARAKAAAEDANVSKTRFLAAASHDILQPLNAARLFASALTERMPQNGTIGAKLADEARGLARNVDASLESVEEILTTLLDMSRLDAGAMKPEITPFRIDDILNQLRVEFEPLALEKNLKLVFAPCSLTVRSDRRLLRRLLQNLISNAIKYTPAGRVLVGCRRRRGRLSIEVWDTGLGIPENKRKAVFREFERLDPGARTAQGLGLGLSIVERLARVLNLKIQLRSRLGQGSCFSVETPIAPALPVMLQGAPLAKTRHQPLAGMVVVAIDNEPRILEGMEILLNGWGCTVVAAEGLADAQAALAAGHLVPTAVVADYHLGEIGGIDAIGALRSQFGKELPAILVTADRSQGVRLEAEAKDIRLLNKPLKPAALRALLTQWHMARIPAE